MARPQFAPNPPGDRFTLFAKDCLSLWTDTRPPEVVGLVSSAGAMPRDLVASARAEIEGSRFLETLWNRIPEDARESFTEAQCAILADAARQCRFNTHPVDIRFSLPLLFKRFYIVVLSGPERRNAERRTIEREKLPLLKLANLLFLVGLTAMGTLLGPGIFTPLLVWYLGS